MAQGVVGIRWLPDELAPLKLYRSTDGSSYSLVTTLADDAIEYDDTGLADTTKYYYKLTDDNGSTYSSVVTVITHTVVSKRNSKTTFQANRAKYDSPTSKDFNDLVNALEVDVNQKHIQSQPCGLCVTDGSIIIDCMAGCDWFRVLVDQDINSVSLIGCDDCPPVDFIIPPDEQHGICGWPVGCDFFGDECYNAQIPGGPLGRTAKTNGLSYDAYGTPAPGNPTGGGGSGGCPCPPSSVLSIECCEADDDCVLDCDTNPTVQIKACGGLGPYTWSSTGSVTLSDTTGTTVTVTADGEGGGGNPDVSGKACAEAIARISYTHSTPCSEGGSGENSFISAQIIVQTCYNCAGATTSCGSFCTTAGTLVATLDGGVNCPEDGGNLMHAISPASSSLGKLGSLGCATVDQTGFGTSTYTSGPLGPKNQGAVTLRVQFTPESGGTAYDETINVTLADHNTDLALPGKFDIRTAQMIADGCPSCEGCDPTDATVTVTDFAGVSVTVQVGP